MKPNNVFLPTFPVEAIKNVPKMPPNIAPQTTSVNIAHYHVERSVKEKSDIAQDTVLTILLGMVEVVALEMIDLAVNNVLQESIFV